MPYGGPSVGKVAFEILNDELPIERLAKVEIYASDLEVYLHQQPKYNRLVGGTHPSRSTTAQRLITGS